MLSIYQLMAIFPEEDRRTSVLIDRQLTSQIDYRLVDNHLSTPAHLALNVGVQSRSQDAPRGNCLQESVAHVHRHDR